MLLRAYALTAFKAFTLAIMVPAAAMLAGTLASPVAAQEAQRASDPAYEDMFDAMDEGVDHEVALDAAMIVVRREYSAVPVIGKMEEESPGLIDDVVRAMRPILRDYQDRVRTEYRPRMTALFAQHLTPQDAREIAAFYRTELGRRILGGVSRNFSPDATLSDIEKFESATDEEVEASVSTDLRNASAATVAELTEADFEEIGRRARENPGLVKLARINPGIIRLRAEMEQVPPNAHEEARIQAAIQGVFEKHVGG